MQTFLPFTDFALSAKSLDSKRLNKQIVEAYQILKAITDPNYGWQNHPIVNMWRGYPQALLDYARECSIEMSSRGTFNIAYGHMVSFYKNNISPSYEIDNTETYPTWLGHEPFHTTHRANLIKKSPSYIATFYGETSLDEFKLIKEISDSTPYLWFDREKESWYFTTGKGRRLYV